MGIVDRSRLATDTQTPTPPAACDRNALSALLKFGGFKVDLVGSRVALLEAGVLRNTWGRSHLPPGSLPGSLLSAQLFPFLVYSDRLFPMLVFGAWLATYKSAASIYRGL